MFDIESPKFRRRLGIAIVALVVVLSILQAWRSTNAFERLREMERTSPNPRNHERQT
jgi:TRAP-type C4-dicarboxylate transport system permease small subunit